MDCLSPDGAVYQAGTLSGNPVAMSAGIAAISKINSDVNLYARLEKLAKKLMEGFKEAAKKRWHHHPNRGSWLDVWLLFYRSCSKKLR